MPKVINLVVFLREKKIRNKTFEKVSKEINTNVIRKVSERWKDREWSGFLYFFLHTS